MEEVGCRIYSGALTVSQTTGQVKGQGEFRLSPLRRLARGSAAMEPCRALSAAALGVVSGSAAALGVVSGSVYCCFGGRLQGHIFLHCPSPHLLCTPSERLELFPICVREDRDFIGTPSALAVFVHT